MDMETVRSHFVGLRREFKARADAEWGPKSGNRSDEVPRDNEKEAETENVMPISQITN